MGSSVYDNVQNGECIVESGERLRGHSRDQKSESGEWK